MSENLTFAIIKICALNNNTEKHGSFLLYYYLRHLTKIILIIIGGQIGHLYKTIIVSDHQVLSVKLKFVKKQ